MDDRTGDVDDLAAQVLAGLDRARSEEDADALADRIARSPASFQVLARIAEIGGFNAIEWLIHVAASAVGAPAAPILVDLSNHRDADIRTDALRALMRLDQSAARSLLPKIRRRLKSADYYEPVEAMWALAALEDEGSIPDIKRASSNWQSKDWRVRVAEIVVAYLGGEHALLLDRMRNHDHISMPWLARAASIIGTDAASATLAWCAREFANDQRCGPPCAKWLSATVGQIEPETKA